MLLITPRTSSSVNVGGSLVCKKSWRLPAEQSSRTWNWSTDKLNEENSETILGWCKVWWMERGRECLVPLEIYSKLVLTWAWMISRTNFFQSQFTVPEATTLADYTINYASFTGSDPFYDGVRLDLILVLVSLEITYIAIVAKMIPRAHSWHYHGNHVPRRMLGAWIFKVVSSESECGGRRLALNRQSYNPCLSG